MSAPTKDEYPGFDPYELLGIDDDATDEKIESAFRKQALRFHPDKCQNVDEEQKKEMDAAFLAITDARDLLLNTHRRRMYDLKRQRLRLDLEREERSRQQREREERRRQQQEQELRELRREREERKRQQQELELRELRRKREERRRQQQQQEQELREQCRQRQEEEAQREESEQESATPRRRVSGGVSNDGNSDAHVQNAEEAREEQERQGQDSEAESQSPSRRPDRGGGSGEANTDNADVENVGEARREVDCHEARQEAHQSRIRRHEEESRRKKDINRRRAVLCMCVFCFCCFCLVIGIGLLVAYKKSANANTGVSGKVFLAIGISGIVGTLVPFLCQECFNEPLAKTPCHRTCISLSLCFGLACGGLMVGLPASYGVHLAGIVIAVVFAVASFCVFSIWCIGPSSTSRSPYCYYGG